MESDTWYLKFPLLILPSPVNKLFCEIPPYKSSLLFWLLLLLIPIKSPVNIFLATARPPPNVTAPPWVKELESIVELILNPPLRTKLPMLELIEVVVSVIVTNLEKFVLLYHFY